MESLISLVNMLLKRIRFEVNKTYQTPSNQVKLVLIVITKIVFLGTISAHFQKISNSILTKSSSSSELRKVSETSCKKIDALFQRPTPRLRQNYQCMTSSKAQCHIFIRLNTIWYVRNEKHSTLYTRIFYIFSNIIIKYLILIQALYDMELG